MIKKSDFKVLSVRLLTATSIAINCGAFEMLKLNDEDYIRKLLRFSESNFMRDGDSFSIYKNWKNGLPPSEDFFPIGVWLQNPINAPAYKKAGINLFVGLWKGPTEEQIRLLKIADMPVICEMNEQAANYINERTIVGWMHADEPDNAQPQADGRGWGPPIPPIRIIEDYNRMKRLDPTRPILLNLGQGVAWDEWYGRGTRTNHPEDYTEYIKGADIISFDIYPVVHEHPDVKGKLWRVAYGVARLRSWSGVDKIIWNCIETTRISNLLVKPTPEQVRSEVWMSIIYGSRGIIYFVHQFKPEFIEPALLMDKEMLSAVCELNRQILRLAPVLNSPTVKGLISILPSPVEIPVAVMVKEKDRAFYIFTVSLVELNLKAKFCLLQEIGATEVEVLDEGRRLKITDNTFEDEFTPYQLHIYRIRKGVSSRSY